MNTIGSILGNVRIENDTGHIVNLFEFIHSSVPLLSNLNLTGDFRLKVKQNLMLNID